MKQNNNVSDFAQKIASVDGPETEIIIKSGILCIKAILGVQQQQQQQLFIVYLTYVIVLVHTSTNFEYRFLFLNSNFDYYSVNRLIDIRLTSLLLRCHLHFFYFCLLILHVFSRSSFLCYIVGRCAWLHRKRYSTSEGYFGQFY